MSCLKSRGGLDYETSVTGPDGRPTLPSVESREIPPEDSWETTLLETRIGIVNRFRVRTEPVSKGRQSSYRGALGLSESSLDKIRTRDGPENLFHGRRRILEGFPSCRSGSRTFPNNSHLIPYSSLLSFVTVGTCVSLYLSLRDIPSVTRIPFQMGPLDSIGPLKGPPKDSSLRTPL